MEEQRDEAVELAELRRRAYGPDGGIDAAGIARLRELERRWQRGPKAPGPTSDATTDDPADTGPVRILHPAEEAAVLTDVAAPEAPEGAPADPSLTTDSGEEDVAGPTWLRRWWTRRPVWAIAGAIVGAAVWGGVGAVASSDAPDAVLPLADRPTDDSFWGDELPFETHELYHSIDIRSSREPDGWCLSYMIQIADGRTGNIDCTPPGGVATLSLWAGGPMARLWGETDFDIEGIEPGAYLRLELHGDVVEVWRVDPPAPSPNA